MQKKDLRLAEREGRLGRSDPPRKAPRGTHVDMRVTPREKDALRSSAGTLGMSITDYVLSRTVYSGEAVEAPPTDELRKTTNELQRQGANLNQMATALNRLAQSGDALTVGVADDIHGTLETVRAASLRVVPLLEGTRPRRRS